jgi:hypothetical protein
MIKKLTTLLMAILPTILSAQPVISNSESFTLGTILIFQNCNATGVLAGDSGASQTWNFSTLDTLGGTSVEWMVSPDSTTHGGLFPTTDLVEKYSNGTFVYVNSSADSSLLSGYVDTVNNEIIKYSDPVLFALRPITYGTIATKNYSDSFFSSSYNYYGQGTATINGDGYGTLILPNGTYNNVLRIKITETESDTAYPSGVVSVTTIISWVWFDGIHTSALLKIDSTHSGTFITKSVEYLSSETSAGIEVLNKETGISIYPNPASTILNIHQTQSTQSIKQLIITDILGNEVYKEILPSIVNYPLSIVNWNPGIYFYEIRSNNDISRDKFVKAF